jgi:hypothetical protein
MKNLPRIAVFAVVAAALAAPVLADPYRVRGLAVTAEAANSNDAVLQGRAQARQMGAQRLIERLTLPEDRQAARQPVEAGDVSRLTNSFDVEVDEKRSAVAGGFRYTATLAYNFDASSVRKYLTDRGVPFVDSQAGKVLLVPTVASGMAPASWGAQWQTQVTSGGQTRSVPKSDDSVLTPYVASTQVWNGHPAWTQIAAEAQSNGAGSAVIAEVFQQAGGYGVRLSDIRPGQSETSLATAGPFSDLASAQAGAVAELERAWKMASVVRTTGATSMEITAAFRSLADWVRIRKGLEGSRLVSNLSIESVSATGADLSFVFAGRPDQLAGDLRARGLNLRSANNGWTVEVASAQ